MASSVHTYGPACSLHVESNAFIRRASELSILPPPLKAHFFYSSALPIDDPLSPVPPPSSGSNTSPSKVPPRPFSIYDNTALEEAWQIIHNPKRFQRAHTNPQEASKESQSYQTKPSPSEPDSGTNDIRGISGSAKERTADRSIIESGDQEDEPAAGKSIRTMDISPTLVNKDTLDGLQKLGDPHLTLTDNSKYLPCDRTKPLRSEEIFNDETEGAIPHRRRRSSLHRRQILENEKLKDALTLSRSLPTQKIAGVEGQYGASPGERDTTGTPFLRAPSRSRRSRSQSYQQSEHESGLSDDLTSEGECARSFHSGPVTQRFHSNQSESLHSDSDGQTKSHSPCRKAKPQKAHITVGISRLHVVELPELRMGPIYWDPIHDVCSVARATWFYKDTMMPVESDVANQIEEGYEYLRPWSTTYADELNRCLEIGAEAEMKVVHRLWPVVEPSGELRPSTARSPMLLAKSTTDKFQPDERDQRRAINAKGNIENQAAGVLDGRDDPARLYEKCSLIYANGRDVQILRPSQLPSVARGRRPLAAIRKGRSVGIPVVRGYDFKAWEKLYPPSKRVTPITARVDLNPLRAATDISERRKSCAACAAEEDRPKATDLVLVIHGIGQKLSERVESFHFTHAINAFRRQINLELESEVVLPWLRQDFGGIMVLPINWRSTLKLGDGGPDPNPNRRDNHSSQNQFTLKDITAQSIPAVRNLISDVMLDIPYYLSHHKTKMVEAVIKEANRVYRLWCRNNPGFEKYGNVHIIAHSLGSVMALDILSKQPTNLPKQLDLKSTQARDDIFEFDTKSLFFCGSPAGFFLLLNKSPLLPRRCRDKPGADGEDLSAGLAGEVGTYGCLAVDNLYNVMHYNDPIAYRLNACVDVDYAASLKPASVPSAANTWMQSIGSIFRSRTIPSTKPTSGEFVARPSIAKMPSTLEMETHDFTREEIAEKRMYLLNDNGQIDYTLHSGGGPLEIQYLNMLSAHSSYWILQDFVRFLVVEIGRKGGRMETMVAMKAIKKVRGKH